MVGTKSGATNVVRTSGVAMKDNVSLDLALLPAAMPKPEYYVSTDK